MWTPGQSSMHLQWIFNNIQMKNSDSPSLLLDSPQYPKKFKSKCSLQDKRLLTTTCPWVLRFQANPCTGKAGKKLFHRQGNNIQHVKELGNTSAMIQWRLTLSHFLSILSHDFHLRMIWFFVVCFKILSCLTAFAIRVMILMHCCAIIFCFSKRSSISFLQAPLVCVSFICLFMNFYYC